MSTAELPTRARHEARLTQSELAIRARTSRPTLSAYEHGRTSPTMETAVRLLAAAGQELTVVPRVEFAERALSRGRTTFVPTFLSRLPVRQARATITLSLHLNWSQPNRQFKLSDRAQRARLYEIVLREGTPGDVLTYIDVALLIDLWDNLVLPELFVPPGPTSSTPLSRGWPSDLRVRRCSRAGPDRLQVRVAQLLFSLPAAQGFLPAGGAALGAQHLTTWPTQDLDFFTRVGATNVPATRNALEIAAHEHGWSIERLRDEATFCRLIIHGADDLLVDLALDSPPQQPATASLIGRTFAPEELAGGKVVALFDRAEARDFADVLELSGHFTKGDLLKQAALVDPVSKSPSGHFS